VTLENLTIGDLVIEAAHEDGLLRLRWLGKSNARAADRLIGPYLEQALARAAELGVPLELRFERLLHFNSSTIASVIKVIEAARARQVRLVIVSDASREWQRLAFDALRVFVQPDGLFEVRGERP
jgi:hypothetical protein